MESLVVIKIMILIVFFMTNLIYNKEVIGINQVNVKDVFKI